MAQSTYRPLNKCDSCGYTWHSRGSNYSLKCPHCGCRDHHEVMDGHGIVQTLQALIVLGLVGFIGIGFIGAVLNSSDESSQPSIEKPTVLPPSMRPSAEKQPVVSKPPCQIWAESNPSLADQLQPGDTCYGF